MRTTVFGVIADILAYIAFTISLIIICRMFPTGEHLGFDYQAILVGIVAGIFTLLIGWNIFQFLDFKKEFSSIEKLKSELHEQLNNIHNKTDFNQALTYAFLSQTVTAHFCPNENELIKGQMIMKGIMGLKIFSNFPDCEKEIKMLSSTLVKGLRNSSETKLPEEFRTKMLLLCGEIAHKDKIPNFNELVALIKVC